MSEIFNSKKIKVFPNEIGGKAKGLLFLEQNNYLTPPFFVLDFNTLSNVINETVELNDIIEKWIEVNTISTDALWAVRSSADNEDGTNQSFAGFFITEINVKTIDLKEAIKKVLLSYSNLKNQEYTAQKKAEFGIIIQEMIRSEYSGVIFSHNPLNVNDDTVHINVIPGIGENLVSGKEEAFSITYSMGKFCYLNSEEIFNGQIYSDKLNTIEKKGEDIKKEISKYLPELVKGTKALSILKNQPCDIEFTIANDIVYWLQIRPITTGKNEPLIWDNTSSEGNFPGITMPLSISMATNSFYTAYKSMAVFLGMPTKFLLQNEPLLQNMSGEINGGLYYNVTAWQKLIYQLPFGKRASRSLPKMWGMKDADFIPEKHSMNILIKLKLFLKLMVSFFYFKRLKLKYLKNFNEIHDQFETVDFNKKSHKELVDIYFSIENRLGGNWETPMLNGFFTILVISTLKASIKRSRLNSKYPNFINDILLSQGDVISVLILKNFQELVSQIQKDKTLKELFKSCEPTEIINILNSNHKLFYVNMNNYILEYGDRSEEGELKMETITYKEDPLLFISYLKKFIQYEMNTERQKLTFNFKTVLNEEYRFNILKRFLFKRLVNETINRVRDRENFKFMRTNTFSLVRRVFRAMDGELLKNKMIDNKDDSLFLLLNEITDLNKVNEYRILIAKRKEEYQNYISLEKANRYIQLGNKFTQDTSNDLSDDGNLISGTGCCSGIVKGEVKVIANNSNTEEYSGKILVANFFEPGKISFFSQASGLISVRGNLLSHTAIVCREMGIPFIVGAKGLLSKVKDGDLIEMDGATGKIKLLLSNE